MIEGMPSIGAQNLGREVARKAEADENRSILAALKAIGGGEGRIKNEQDLLMALKKDDPEEALRVFEDVKGTPGWQMYLESPEFIEAAKECYKNCEESGNLFIAGEIEKKLLKRTTLH